MIWGVAPFVTAQEKKIDTVFISDKKLNESVHFQKVINLSDNIHKNTSNLSETLRFLHLSTSKKMEEEWCLRPLSVGQRHSKQLSSGTASISIPCF